MQIPSTANKLKSMLVNKIFSINPKTQLDTRVGETVIERQLDEIDIETQDNDNPIQQREYSSKGKRKINACVFK